MSRVLITGGAGFIGSHLAAWLLASGDEVIVLDNLYSSSRRNLRGLLGSPNFEFIRGDVTFDINGIEVDQIYHLACPASPVHYQRDPVQTVKTSVHGSINVLGLAARLGAKVLLTSTSEVYGDPEIHPQVEEYWGNVNPVGPRACYDEGKRCAETLFTAYRDRGVDAKIARIFNTYGPHLAVDDGRVVSNFIVQALRGDPLTVYGDGTQTRSFCYVRDMVAGLVSLMNTPGVSGPVNLGNPEEYAVRDIAELVLELTASVSGVRTSRVEYRPLPQDDPRMRRPDITLARRELDWYPVTGLREGLADTIDYFIDVLAESPAVPSVL